MQTMPGMQVLSMRKLKDSSNHLNEKKKSVWCTTDKIFNSFHRL